MKQIIEGAQAASANDQPAINASPIIPREFEAIEVDVRKLPYFGNWISSIGGDHDLHNSHAKPCLPWQASHLSIVT